MVYKKKQSGDPDYDDKQPIDHHGGRLVVTGDGREVVIHEATGPVDRYTGQHVSLEGPTGDDLDNRPKPGEVAKEPSAVQTFDVKDTPMAPNGEPEPAAKVLAEGREEQAKDPGAAPKVESEKASDADSKTPSSDGETAKGVDTSPATGRGSRGRSAK